MPDERTPLFPLGWPLAEDLAKIIYALPNDAIRAAWLDLIRPRSVLHALQSIRTQNGPDHAQRQRDVDLKPTALQRALVHPVLVDEEHPERLEAQVPQSQLVALVILTEAARPTWASGHVDVLFGHSLIADPLALLAQEVREVPGGEARGAALSDVGQLSTQQEIISRRNRQWARLIAEVLEHGFHDVLGAPVEPPV